MLSSALRACWTSHVNLSQRETNISSNERRRQLRVVFQSKEAVLFLFFVDKTPVRDHHLILRKLEWKGGEKMCYCLFSFFYGLLTLAQQANSPSSDQICSPSPHVNVSASVGRKKSHRSQIEKRESKQWCDEIENAEFTDTGLDLNNSQMPLFSPPPTSQLQSSLGFQCKNYHLGAVSVMNFYKFIEVCNSWSSFRTSHFVE